MLCPEPGRASPTGPAGIQRKNPRIVRGYRDAVKGFFPQNVPNGSELGSISQTKRLGGDQRGPTHPPSHGSRRGTAPGPTAVCPKFLVAGTAARGAVSRRESAHPSSFGEAVGRPRKQVLPAPNRPPGRPPAMENRSRTRPRVAAAGEPSPPAVVEAAGSRPGKASRCDPGLVSEKEKGPVGRAPFDRFGKPHSSSEASTSASASARASSSAGSVRKSSSAGSSTCGMSSRSRTTLR